MVVSRLSCKLSKSNNSRAAPGARGAGEEYSTGLVQPQGFFLPHHSKASRAVKTNKHHLNKQG